MAIFRELDCVIAVGNPAHNIPSGTIGVVHQVYESGEMSEYLVEFLEGKGPYVIDIITVKENDLKRMP